VTLAEMITTARIRADDTAAPYLWSDAEWVGYANDAEREAARRSRLLVDSSTAEIVEVSLTAGDVVVDLDPRVLFIRRARLVGRSGQLQRISSKDLDACTPDWEDETGEVAAYVPDIDTRKFRPYPTPTANGTVKLTVVRLPLSDMAINDEPELPGHLHESLIGWMLFRAYSKQDEDTRDPAKAATNLAIFEAEFGRKSSAIDEAWIQREHGYIQDEGIY
jgi:hypothetical protein